MKAVLGCIAVVALVAGAFVLGQRSASTQAATTPAPARVSVDLTPMEREIQALRASQTQLRADLAQAQPACPAAERRPDAPTDAPAPAPLSARGPAALAAEDTAHDVLDTAVRAGRWTAEDRRRMNDALALTDDTARVELLREFSVAVNRKQLKVDGLEGPPL